MTTKTSTGLDDKLLDTNPFKTIMNLGFINIYADSGPEPSSADDAIPGTATLLCTVSNNSTGTGLTMAAAAAGRVISKNTSETWSGPVTNPGALTPKYYRHVAAGDDGTLSTTQARVQGDIGLGGTDMVLATMTMADASTFTLNYYNFTLPSY